MRELNKNEVWYLYFRIFYPHRERISVLNDKLCFIHKSGVVYEFLGDRNKDKEMWFKAMV